MDCWVVQGQVIEIVKADHRKAGTAGKIGNNEEKAVNFPELTEHVNMAIRCSSIPQQ